MDELALSVRYARPSDAAELARIFIESWQDTYAGLISHSLLSAMSLRGHTARWQATMRGPGAVLVAEDAAHGAIGLASVGVARDSTLGYEGEIYTLYVDPAFLGRGVGRMLMGGAFETFKDRKLRSCIVWAHAQNNACFFYERLGGKRVAVRTVSLMGAPTPEVGFGWKQLAARRQTRTIQS
jgi:ribosomal protein S18 acetylase RimI-like enzyme